MGTKESYVRLYTTNQFTLLFRQGIVYLNIHKKFNKISDLMNQNEDSPIILQLLATMSTSSFESLSIVKAKNLVYCLSLSTHNRPTSRHKEHHMLQSSEYNLLVTGRWSLE